MKMNPVVFREYDIRGVFNLDFDCDFAYALGRAFVTYVRRKSGVKQPRLTLGYDARLSSPAIADALCAGFKASGAHVLRLGLVTSPISYFSTFTVENVQGGIMVTGSHNPPEYNGFKVSFNRTTIFGAEIKELEKIIEAGEPILLRNRTARWNISSGAPKRRKQLTRMIVRSTESGTTTRIC